MRGSIFAPFECKLAGNAEAGEFDGYASVFGVKDAHGDLILPGAFKDSLAERKDQGRSLPMHVMHGFLGGDGIPVGVWQTVEEDSKGLAVKGKISGATTTDAGRLLHERVKDGALPGLSIGWSKRPEGIVFGSKSGEPKRTLKAVNLHEISLVSDPSNAKAMVINVKASPGDVDKAAGSIAAAMAMHDQVMKRGSGSYYGGSAKDQALMMDHLRDAHEALTGSRSPHGLEGWTKSLDDLVAGMRDLGVPEELARGFADVALKATPRLEQADLSGFDPETKAVLDGLSSFALPAF